MHLIVNYPEKLPDALQQSPEQFEREAKMAMAVKLYEMKKISSGTVASLAGLERVEFLTFGASLILGGHGGGLSR